MSKRGLILLGVSVLLFLAVGAFAFTGKIEYETWLASGAIIGSLVANLAQMLGIKERDDKIDRLKRSNRLLGEILEKREE